MPDYTIGGFSSIGPEMENDFVGLSRNSGDFLSLVFRQIQNLDPARGNIDLMVMIKLVPGLQRYLLTRDSLGNEIFDVSEPRVGIGRFKQQVLDLRFDESFGDSLSRGLQN